MLTEWNVGELKIRILSESELLLFNTKWAMFQPYYGENKLHINEKTVMYTLYMISWILIVLAQWNKSLQVDMLLHSDTLSWFWAKQSLLLFCNGVYLVEKLQKPIL